MARLINSTRRDIVLPTRHVVPAQGQGQGQLETTNEVINCADNWPKVNGLILAGDLVAEFDPPPEVADAPAPVIAAPAPQDAEAGSDPAAASKAARQKP
jgi:hypothetical protein